MQDIQIIKMSNGTWSTKRINNLRDKCLSPFPKLDIHQFISIFQSIKESKKPVNHQLTKRSIRHKEKHQTKKIHPDSCIKVHLKRD